MAVGLDGLYIYVVFTISQNLEKYIYMWKKFREETCGWTGMYFGRNNVYPLCTKNYNIHDYNI
jgi:hypothetical protein